MPRLNPFRRGYLLGLHRARQQARKQLRILAEEYDAELASLGDEFGRLTREDHVMEEVIGFGLPHDSDVEP